MGRIYFFSILSVKKTCRVYNNTFSTHRLFFVSPGCHAVARNLNTLEGVQLVQAGAAPFEDPLYGGFEYQGEGDNAKPKGKAKDVIMLAGGSIQKN